MTNNTDIPLKVYYALRVFQENESLILLGCLPVIFWMAVDKIVLKSVRMSEFNLGKKITMREIIWSLK